MMAPVAAVEWSVYPVGQLRSSGFGFAATVPRPPGAAALTEAALCAAEEKLAAVRHEFTTGVFPALRDRFRALARADRDALVAAARRVRRGEPLAAAAEEVLRREGYRTWAARWAEATAAWRAAAAHGRDSFEAESDAVLAGVRRSLAGPRVAQAVTQSAPGYAERLYRARADPQPSRIRAKERAGLVTGHRFLRRLGARCETVSFFGPSLFVRLDPEQSAPLWTDAPGPETVSVDAAAWLIRELAGKALRRLPRSQWWVSRDPLWRLDGGALVRVIDGRALPVGPEAARWWERLTGWCKLDKLTAIEPDGARLAQALRTLRPALRFGPAVPATERDALARLAREVPDDPDVGEVRARLRAVERTPGPERQDLLRDTERVLRERGYPTGRGAGEQYADRTFWHEERGSPYSERTVFGAPVVAAVERALAAAVPPLYLLAVLERADARAAVRTMLDGRPVNLALAAARELPPPSGRADAFRAALADLARRRAGDRGVARLTAGDVAELCRPFWAALSAADREPAPALPGFDLLAAGDRIEAAQWVVGEVHDDSSSILGGSSSRVHSRPDGLYADFCAHVAELVPVDRMAGVVSRRRTMHITPELPGLAIELAGVSAKEPHQVVPIAEAEVCPDGTAVAVRGRRYWLYPGDLPSTLHRALSLPGLRSLGWPAPRGAGESRTPRIEVDGVVLRRATWTLHLPEPARPGYQHWRHVQRLRREHGIPRRVFARLVREPKPVYLDLDDPVAVDDLARLGGGWVRLSECLPDADQLWWRPDGAAQVAELRLACLIGKRPEER